MLLACVILIHGRWCAACSLANMRQVCTRCPLLHPPLDTFCVALDQAVAAITNPVLFSQSLIRGPNCDTRSACLCSPTLHSPATGRTSAAPFASWWWRGWLRHWFGGAHGSGKYEGRCEGSWQGQSAWQGAWSTRDWRPIRDGDWRRKQLRFRDTSLGAAFSRGIDDRFGQCVEAATESC